MDDDEDKASRLVVLGFSVELAREPIINNIRQQFGMTINGENGDLNSKRR